MEASWIGGLEKAGAMISPFWLKILILKSAQQLCSYLKVSCAAVAWEGLVGGGNSIHYPNGRESSRSHTSHPNLASHSSSHPSLPIPQCDPCENEEHDHRRSQPRCPRGWRTKNKWEVEARASCETSASAYHGRHFFHTNPPQLPWLLPLEDIGPGGPISQFFQKKETLQCL